MVKTFDCVKCGGPHARPINRNCKNMENNKPMDTNAQILNELKSLGGYMSQIESRMDNLSSKSSSPSRTSSRSESAERSLARTPEVRTQTTRDSASSLEEDLVLPTLAMLRHSRSIQDQVDTRIRELQAVDKEKGKFKSQRGGSETIWVKMKLHGLITLYLVVIQKNRVTYDSLSLSQRVSGFATIIRDENDVEVKSRMLEYLSELMEDSHDFGWASAKGSHAVLLCRMQEAHRSTFQSQTTSGNKKVGQNYSPNPCKYYPKELVLNQR